MRAFIAIPILALFPAPLPAQEKSNPFTGTTAAFEQRLRLLEERKLDAAIANEDLATEKANQERLRLRSGRTAGSFDVPAIDSPKAPPVRRPVPATLTMEPLGAAAPAKPKTPRLVGTVSTPSGWVALVEKGSAILNVPEGGSVDGVKATGITREAATVNGVAMTLEATTARVAAPAAPMATNTAPRLSSAGAAGALSAAPIDTIDLGTPVLRK